MKFCSVDTQTEALLEHGLKMREVHTVGDVLVHGPTFQPVQVLIPPPKLIFGHNFFQT